MPPAELTRLGQCWVRALFQAVWAIPRNWSDLGTAGIPTEDDPQSTHDRKICRHTSRASATAHELRAGSRTHSIDPNSDERTLPAASNHDVHTRSTSLGPRRCLLTRRLRSILPMEPCGYRKALQRRLPARPTSRTRRAATRPLGRFEPRALGRRGSRRGTGCVARMARRHHVAASAAPLGHATCDSSAN